jgi:hypothetical protein
MFGCGATLGVALNRQGEFAIATAANQVLLGDVATRRVKHVLAKRADRLAFSGDGSVLAALGSSDGAQYFKDRNLDLFDTGTGTRLSQIVSTQGYTDPYLFVFGLSTDASRVWLNRCQPASGPWFCDDRVTDRIGQTTYLSKPYSGSGPSTSALSADGRTFASCPVTASARAPRDGHSEGFCSATIYRDGALTGIVTGAPMAWLDDGHLLVQQYNQGTANPKYQRSVVVDAQGAVTSEPPLPPLYPPLRALRASTMVFSSDSAGVYRLDNGMAVWSSPNRGIGDANDTHVLFSSDTRVVLVPY